MVHNEHTHTGPDGSPMQCLEPSSVGIKWIKGLRGCDLASHWNLQSRWCDLHATYTAWINNQGGSSVTHKGFDNQGVQIDHAPVVGNQGGYGSITQMGLTIKGPAYM